MLELKRFKEDKEAIVNGLLLRNYSVEQTEIVEKVILLDNKRKKTQTENDQLLSEVNKASKEIGELFKQGKQDEAQSLKANIGSLKDKIKEGDESLKECIEELEKLLLSIPNIPNAKVPAGNSDEENQVVKDWGNPLPNLSDDAKAHWDLGEQYDILDFKLGVKLTGSGFPVFKGKGAALQRALIQFFLAEANKAGYTEYGVPFMVNAESAKATGQLPDKEGQMYHITADEFYMIPTAEVPLTNIYRDVILSKDDFPIKLVGYTPCFRREAGSYGSDVKGLNRVHQFDKIEIVQVSHPSESYKVLDQMLNHVEELLIKLELPYRILCLCGGDLTFASALTYDFEVFAAGQNKWLEVSSVSNFETYQSNRLKLRFKNEDNKNQLAHTLNGSALALARIIAAILENNQTEQGIKIPKVLVPFMGCEFID